MTGRLSSRGRDATAARNSDLVAACVRRSWPLMAHLAPTLTGPIGLVLQWQGPRPTGMVLPPGCAGGTAVPRRPFTSSPVTGTKAGR